MKNAVCCQNKSMADQCDELDRGRVLVDVEYLSASWLLACYEGHSTVYGHVLVNFN